MNKIAGAALALVLPVAALFAGGHAPVQARHVSPTATPTLSPTSTQTPVASATGTATLSGTATGTATNTATPATSPTPTATPPSAAGYNGAAAAAYADQYWSAYNPAWPSFANSGGDCTNFVSQALYAGGIAMRTSPPYSGAAAWYMIAGHRWSYSTSWVNAQDNSTFLPAGLSASRVNTVTGVAPGVTIPSGASQGDVISYDWNDDGTIDHQAIVTTADGQYVDAHTNDRYHAYWTLAQVNPQWQTTVVTVYHIAPGTK